MKTRQTLKILIALLGAMLLQFGVSAQNYQFTSYTNTFDNDGNTGQYENGSAIYWYSIYQDYNLTVQPNEYNYPMTNDAAMDADGDTNDSGSLYVYTPFNSTSNHDQNVFYFTFQGGGSPFNNFDSSLQIPVDLITNISFKIHVDPRSKPDPDGNFGVISFGVVGQATPSSGYTSGANSSYFQQVTIPGAATNGWVVLSQTNAAADAIAYVNGTGVTNAFGMDFDYNNYGGLPTNPVAFWIDDAVIQTSSAPPPPPPPPVLSIVNLPAPGLNLFPGQGTSFYQRENLETVNESYSWINAGGPVSFSYTISSYAVKPGDGFQTQIFLIPNPGTESAPDYNEPNLIFLDMENGGSGNATWSFRFKTNEVNGNSQVYGNGTLATITSATEVGTWKATFNNNTNVTMLAPDGTSTNFNIPDLSAYFNQAVGSNVALYFGVQAGNLGGTSDHIAVSDFKVTGLGAASFDDNFVADNGVLNQSLWETNANYAPSIQLLSPQPGNQYVMVNWTSPALNYSLAYANTIPTNSWALYQPGGTPPVPTQLGSNYNVIVNTNLLPIGNPAFFQVVQPGQ